MRINTQTLHVQLDPRNPDFFNNPYPYYAELRAKTPIFFWEEFGFWSFVDHEDVSTLLRDRRFGRQITHLATRAELGWPPEREDLKPFYAVDLHSLLELEPPDHTRLRGLIQKAFMARRIDRLSPRIAQLSHQLIDQMEPKGQANLLTDFATTIPVYIIAELIGVPTSMSQSLLDWSHAMVGMYELARSPKQEQAAVRAAQEFVAYLREIVSHRRKEPKDDLISKLIEVEEAEKKLSEDELISTCILLLNAGHEATVNVVGNGLYALLRNRQELERWQHDPLLTPNAVEELMRFDTPLHLFNRWLLDDVTYKGHRFPFGTQVALLLGAANRDPCAFENPARLDLDRVKNPHVSFGGGIHYCLGAPLARLELRTSLPILLERLPHMEIVQEPSYRNSYHFHGLEALWVRW